MSTNNTAAVAVATTSTNTTEVKIISSKEEQRRLYMEMEAAYEAEDRARAALNEAIRKRSDAVKAFYKASQKKRVAFQGTNCSIVQRGDNWFLRGKSEKREDDIFVLED